MANVQLNKIQASLALLQERKDMPSAKEAVRAIAALLVPSLSNGDETDFRWLNDGDRKLTANAGWFFTDSFVTDRLAAYKLSTPDEANLDFKIYGVKKATKSVISWLVGLTPNFEDEPFNGPYNVGIDFIIPESKDRVIVALSKNYVIRTMELHGQLTATYLEILSQWASISDLSRKAELHELLWSSLDLHPINRKFYEGISERFTSLKQHLESRNILSHDQAAHFANRLLGRVIFTWFLNKKELLHKESEYFNSADFGDDTDYYHERLEELFFGVLNTPIENRTAPDNHTPYLNGGLFEPKPGDLYKAENLTFPRNFFDDLFGFLLSYNFTTDESTSEFQHVAIDPEMLGRIFENLLAEISDDTGEQARKARGAFYTPREIVDYMCKEALKGYLRACFPDDDDFENKLYQVIDASERSFQDQDHNWRRDLKPYKEDLLAALTRFKVLDPACGSGAFPIGMLQLLLKVYSRLETKFDPFKAKLGILQRNIFGVDIEPMAIEISRLRAWLSLIVDSQSSGAAVKPLPNLDFKFVCANSLNDLAALDLLPFGEDASLAEKLQELREDYFSTESLDKKTKLREKYSRLVDQDEGLFADSERTKQLKSFRPFDADNSATFFDPEHMFGVSGFDLVIGNPPYVAPKGVDADTKKVLTQKYGFADDLYSHFFFRGFELLTSHGVLSYISSKTFWTIQSKKNLRELLLSKRLEYLYDTSNPFDSAMVDTCIVMSCQVERKSKSRFYTISQDYSKPIAIEFDKALYEQASNAVFFPPTEGNLNVYNKFNGDVKSLIDTWWYAIKTSAVKLQNSAAIDAYVGALKPGDTVLLGTIVDGGQGLATGNNGRYLGVLRTSKFADKIQVQRREKLIQALLSKKDNRLGDTEESIGRNFDSLSEDQVFDLMENIKEQYGRDVFGKGFIYRIVYPESIHSVSDMSDSDKKDGLTSSNAFVPYDKGDRDGNSWVLPTPFYIEWSKDKVSELKQSSGKKHSGAAVIRNPQFYFLPGVCWIQRVLEGSLARAWCI
jgi:hypothetical protein